MGCRSGAQGSRSGKLETVPSKTDEITMLFTGGDYDSDGRLVFKASLCCEDRSDLILDLIEILNSLHLKTLIEILNAQRVFNPFIPSSPENTRKQPKIYRVFNPFITENHPRPTKKQAAVVDEKNRRQWWTMKARTSGDGGSGGLGSGEGGEARTSDDDEEQAKPRRPEVEPAVVVGRGGGVAWRPKQKAVVNSEQRGFAGREVLREGRRGRWCGGRGN
ncbi:hypothetical protein LR48_Vigan10g109800 [Vigna angularis]|uniref:Uncharacterized protein n=1 Tax=Phaseolus angularis TaxID=3914 RepID=A0A0L9VJI2_PHAAN|nr:hypothetical protein LR48_Vigan10g109800 [Vigna angularis]